MKNKISMQKIIFISLLWGVLFGCAKKLPIKISEDIERDVHSMELFDGKAKIKTVGKGESASVQNYNDDDSLSLQSKGTVSLKLRNVEFISGDEKLRPFFKKFKIESSRAGEIFEISFEVTDSFLIAYADTEGHKLSLRLSMGKQGGRVPIFQYPISKFGILARKKNDLEEETRTVEFKERNRVDATHVKISTLVEKRTDIGENIELAGKVFANVKKHFNTEDEYIYVPMTMGVPRAITESRPFHQGDEKIVKMKFTNDGLQLFQVESDERFADNSLNHHPVLTIPGEYKDFRCKKNLEGKCVDANEGTVNLEFSEKSFFVPKFENMTINEVNTLDLLGPSASSCVSEIGTPRVVDYLIKKGVLNIQIERTYRVSERWHCAAGKYFSGNLHSSGFKVQFYYSVVKLADLESKGYKKVDYPTPDHSVFGFFKVLDSKLNDINDHSRKDEKYYLERWNPDKGVIHFHLSDSFDRSKNKIYRDATFKAMETVNKTLKHANTGLRIQLHEPSGKKAGDLRYNMIVLVDDPVNTGLLGYAPVVANPRTGEILQGHTNMYSGVLRSLSRRVYQEMVDLTESRVSKEKKDMEKGLKDSAPLAENSSVQKSMNIKGDISYIMGDQTEKFKNEIKRKGADVILEEKRRAQTLANVRTDQSDLQGMDKLILEEKEKLEYYARENIFAEEFFNIGGTAKAVIGGIEEIEGIKKEDGSLKHWESLTKEQKKEAADLISIHGYTSTLVHEIGHNLGLRHNFTGSFDSANFYSEEEAKKLGLKSSPAYSSVMDYAISSLNELTVFGKYDTAALRFGYAREVELSNGEFAKIKTTYDDFSKEIDDFNTSLGEGEEDKKKEIKEYRFCTDGNAGLSASCRRHDEGTNLVEIAKGYIERYDRLYKYRNLRDKRKRYNNISLLQYAVSRIYEFNKMRDVFEEWESFVDLFSFDLMVMGCNDDMMNQYRNLCTLVNDRRDSALEMANFFLRVLKTPDHTCAIADKSSPDKVKRMETFVSIYDSMKFRLLPNGYVPKSCFDSKIKEKLASDGEIIIAESGKFLNGFKDHNKLYPYSNDRYALGTWVDKLLAMKSLYKRRSAKSTTERAHMALIDIPSVASKVGNFLRHITMGEKLDDPIPFKKEDGSEIVIDYKIDNSYMINAPHTVLTGLKSYFNLPLNGNALLNEKLLQMAFLWGKTDDQERRDSSRNFVNYVTVRRHDLEDPFKATGIVSYKDESKELYYGASEANGIAKSMIDSILGFDYLKNIKEEKIKNVVKYRLNPPLPDGLTENEKVLINLELPHINGLIRARESGAEELNRDRLVAGFGEELADKFLLVWPLGLETFKRIKKLKLNMGKAPDVVPEEERRLYDIELDDLQSFLDGGMEKSNLIYKRNLKILPNYEKSREGKLWFMF